MDEPEKLRRPVPPNKRDFAAIDLSAQTRLVFADPTQADLSQSITGEIEHPSIEEPRRDCKTSSSPGSTLLPTTQPIKSLRSENRQGGARFSGDGARFGEDGATNGAGGLAMIDDAESSKAPGARFLKTLTDNPFGRLLQTFLAAIGRFVLYVFPTLLDERTKYHLQALGFGRRYHADIFVGLKAAAIASVVWAFVQELCAHPHLMFGFPVLLFLLIVITWTIGNFFLACWVAEL